MKSVIAIKRFPSITETKEVKLFHSLEKSLGLLFKLCHCVVDTLFKRWYVSAGFHSFDHSIEIYVNVTDAAGPAEQFLKWGGRWPPLLKWGWGVANLAVLSLWLFRTVRLMNLFLESLSSGVMFIHFKPLKSTLFLLSLIAKCRIHQ